MGRVIQGHPGIGNGVVEGEALVADDGFSARYDLDLETGRFSRPTHRLFGQSFADKIIVLDHAKGGVASAWMLHVLMKSAHRPKALLLNTANPIMAQGASFGSIPLVDRFSENITSQVNSGDQLRVDPRLGTVEVLSENSSVATVS